MLIQRTPLTPSGIKTCTKPQEANQGEPESPHPTKIQRAGGALAGAVSGAVCGTGAAVASLRHAPILMADLMDSGFHEYRSGPLAQPPGNPLTDLLRDSANAALFATLGIPFVGLLLAGQLVAVPLLFTLGGALEGALGDESPCQLARDFVDASRRYDNWYVAAHNDYLETRARDEAYDAEHGRS